MGDPPQGMRATVHHDGVEWNIQGPGGVGGVLLGLAGLCVGVGSVGVYIGWPWLGLLPLLVLCLVVAQGLRRTRVQVTDRGVAVEVKTLMGTERTTIPLHALAVAKLVEPEVEGGAWSLVVRAEEGRGIGIGEGQPRAHLAWLLEAIDEVRRRNAEREAVEGREYSFMRRAPEAIEDLRSGPTGD